MKIGIVGNGVVGSATAAVFRDHVDEVRCWDIEESRRTTPSILHTLASDLVFVCLPTPQQRNLLACDLSKVESFFAVLTDNNKQRNYVLRSTVPIGTTRMLREKYGLTNLVHSPEFLTARTAVEDACNPTRMIIGLPDFNGPMEEITTDSCYSILQELYEKLFDDRRHWYTSLPIFTMTSDESEAVKLFQNSYSAVVVSLLNEFRCLADKRGMDWDRVMQALLASGWLAPRHTQVPGPDGRRGFGGACLPKDLANLIQCMDDAGVQRLVTAAALMRNEHIDRME